MRALVALATFILVGAAAPDARAEGRNARGCLDALEVEGVDYRRVRRRGIAIAVEVRGRLGGVEYRPFRDRRLILDCSLVVSLARAGRFLRAHGIERATYSSAYQRRNVRGTSRPSKHSYGLALDIHSFHTADDRRYDIKDDYEQGLGDDVDCIGAPLTDPGRVLRTIDCQLERSELFDSILTPDYDVAHYNHFHVEALPWDERVEP